MSTAKRVLVAMVLAVAGGALSPTTGLAEVDEAAKRLFDARSLKCQYTSRTYTKWQSGRAVTELSNEADMVLHFDSIDETAMSARLIANLGAADVSVITTASAVHFLEVTPVGYANFTTVFTKYAKGTRDFVSVSSRHVDLDGPFPSQHHGTCQVWE